MRAWAPELLIADRGVFKLPGDNGEPMLELPSTLWVSTESVMATGVCYLSATAEGVAGMLPGLR